MRDSSSMRLIPLAVLLVLGISSCDSHRSAQEIKAAPIVFDDWWNVDYVKNGCEMVEQSRNHGDTELKPCRSDATPAQIVQDFENELQLAFATESACHGLTLFHFTPEMANAAVKNPSAPATGVMATMAGPQWSLMLDLDGTSDSQTGNNWSIADPHNHIVSGHITTPERTVEQICKVVKGVGGQMGQ